MCKAVFSEGHPRNPYKQAKNTVRPSASFGVLSASSGVLSASFGVRPETMKWSCVSGRYSGSNLMSTDTLERGLSLLRSATMSIESDPLYQEMLKEKEVLLDAFQ